MGRKRRKSTTPEGTEQIARKTVAFFAPHDASGRFRTWKESNRELLQRVPDTSVEVITYWYGPGRGDGIEVRVDPTWAGLFEEAIDPPREA